jgi:predicted transcriptional regulator
VEPTCQTLVGDLAIDPVIRVSPNVPLREAARLLAMTSADVLVLDTTPVAEMTERDVVRAIALGIDPATRVADVEREAPELVLRNTPLKNVMAVFLATGRRTLVVVDDGVPVGMIRLPMAVTATFGGGSWLGALRVALRIEGGV